MLDPDGRVHDPMAMAEIELYGELVIAASSSDGPLPQAAIDEVLGVGADGDTGGAATELDGSSPGAGSQARAGSHARAGSSAGAGSHAGAGPSAGAGCGEGYGRRHP